MTDAHRARPPLSQHHTYGWLSLVPLRAEVPASGGGGPSWHARRTSGEEEVPGRTDGRTPPQGTAASSGLSSLPCRPSRRNPSRARRAGFLEKGPRGLCHDRSPLPAPQEAAGGNAARRTLNLGLWPFSGRSSNVSQQPRRKNPPTRAWGLGVQDPRRPPPPSEAPTVTTEPFPAGGRGGAYIPEGPPTTPVKARSRAVEPRTGRALESGQTGPQDQPPPGGWALWAPPILLASPALIPAQDRTHPPACGDPPKRPRRGFVRGSSKALWPLWQGPQKAPSETHSHRLVGAGGQRPLPPPPDTP